MTDISSAFETMALEMPITQHHMLHLTYPALHLLPPGTHLYLTPPTDCSYRERPGLGTYHLDDLSFFHRFPVTSQVYHAPLNDHGSSDLLDVSTLAAASGESHLECVSYVDTDGVVQHAVHLTVSWGDQDGEVNYFFQLSDRELQLTLSLNAARSAHLWLDLLSNLIYRRSDRAYLHVKKQLQAQDPAAAAQQEALWVSVWDSEPNITGRDMLMSRLKCELQDGSKVALSDLDPENLAAHSHQQLSVLLPCGHTQLHAYAHLRTMSDSTCLDALCHECRQPVLSASEMISLNNRLNRTERDNFYWEEVDLVALDAPVLTTGREIEASVDETCYVLEDTLNGFEVPASATPSMLSFVTMPETRAVLYGLQRALRAAAGDVLRATPTNLLQDFEEEGMRALMSFIGEDDLESTVILPPGLLTFIGKWLRRAVNHLSGVQREVSNDEVDDLSLHFGEVQVSDTESQTMKMLSRFDSQ